MFLKISFLLSSALLTLSATARAQWSQNFVHTEDIQPCQGDTRGDRKCNHDFTHRVCAKIGLPNTSFFDFTGQTNWCNTIGYYGGEYGDLPRCPINKPTWCICKWALARWIGGQGCDEDVQIDCKATDICNLKASYYDYDVHLKPAHDCVERKCPEEWAAC